MRNNSPPSEGLVRLIGAMVFLLAAPQVQLSVSVGNGWPHAYYITLGSNVYKVDLHRTGRAVDSSAVERHTVQLVDQ